MWLGRILTVHQFLEIINYNVSKNITTPTNKQTTKEQTTNNQTQQHSTFNIQHSTFNDQHSTINNQQTTINKQQTTIKKTTIKKQQNKRPSFLTTKPQVQQF